MPLLKHCLAGFCLAIPLEICTKRGTSSESVTHSTKKAAGECRCEKRQEGLKRKISSANANRDYTLASSAAVEHI